MAQIHTTLTITHAEVLDILKVHFNLRDDTHITITAFHCQDDDQHVGWIDVPSDWDLDEPPFDETKVSATELMFGDGYVISTHSREPWSWCQHRELSARIVKYRILEASKSKSSIITSS